MSALDQGRLLTAEVKWGGDADAIFWAGTAPIHQFWPRLAPQFSAVLLAPQRRMEGDVVAWTWRESDRDEAITAAELLALRGLLGTGLESFRKGQPPGNESSADGAAATGRTNLDLLWDAVGAMIAHLLARSDRDLLAFVVRTEAGPRIHSWGAKRAASALAPEQLGHEVSGIVVAAGKAAADAEVQMKDASGEIHAKLLSDGTGRFRFSNVAPGNYRLFVLQGETPLPNEGLEVSVVNQGITGLKLRIPSAAAEAEPVEAAVEPTARPRRRRGIFAVLLGGAGLAGGLFYWRTLDDGKAAVSPPAAATPAPAASPRQGQASTSPRRSTTVTTTATMDRNGRATAVPAQANAHQARPETALQPAAAISEQTSSLRPGASPSSSPAAQTPAPSSSSAASATGASVHSDIQDRRSSSPDTTSPVSNPLAARPSQARHPVPSPRSLPANAPHHPATPSDSSAPQNPEAASAGPSPSLPAWTHRNRMTAETWKIRLLVDPILPTDPTSDPSPAAVEVLRQRAIAEQLSAMPSAFRTLKASRGYAVQLPLNDPRSAYRWQLPTGAQSGVTTSLAPGRAELSWVGHSFPSPGIYELMDGQGRARFRLEVLRTNVATISRTAGVHASYWLEVAVTGAEAGSAARFSWQRASGGAIPSSWQGSRFNRIEIPLTDSVGTEINSDLAFFDSVTGWAATSQLKFSSVPSLGSPSPVP
jgi:hypothetical protein